jgi:hypothetical protein
MALGLAIALGIAVLLWAVVRGLSLVGWIVGLPPACSYARAHEQLPAVFVEEGRTVYCRMRYCDFRFPLPDGAQVLRTNLQGGGYDTIQGSVDVRGSQDRQIDYAAYARVLRAHRFTVNSGPDVASFNASTADGGCLRVEYGSIIFSYFGDY